MYVPHVAMCIGVEGGQKGRPLAVPCQGLLNIVFLRRHRRRGSSIVNSFFDEDKVQV